MSGSQRQNRWELVSLSCHEECKMSLILKLWSWRSHEKVMEKILNLVDTPCIEFID